MGDMFGVGTMTGGAMQAAGQIAAQRKNIRATRHARQWQEMMASTAYQRTVKDLQAAGLNPALAFGHVNTASTPNTQIPQFSNVMEGMGETVMHGAKQAALLGSERRILKEKEKAAASEALTAKNAATASQYMSQDAYARVFERNSNAAYLEQQAMQSNAQRDLIESMSRGQSYDNMLKKADAEFYSTDFGQKMRATERVLDSIGGLGRFQVGAPRPNTTPTKRRH